MDVAGAAAFTQQLPPIGQLTFPLSSVLQHGSIFLHSSPQHAGTAGFVAGAAAFSAAISPPTVNSKKVKATAKANPLIIFFTNISPESKRQRRKHEHPPAT